MRVVAAGLTDVGCVRSHNEDSLLLSHDLGFFVVADGLGGHAAGEVASKIVVERMAEVVAQTTASDYPWPLGYDEGVHSDGNRLRTAVLLADDAIEDDIRAHPERESMGSTMVACLAQVDGVVTVAHVGDSRAYMMNRDGMRQLTQDHSWVMEQVERGILTAEEALDHELRNVITQALGNGSELDVAIQQHVLQPFDRILLCSDGLTGMVDDAEIFRIVSHTTDLEVACRKLIHRAREQGGKDNITAIIVGFLPN